MSTNDQTAGSQHGIFTDSTNINLFYVSKLLKSEGVSRSNLGTLQRTFLRSPYSTETSRSLNNSRISQSLKKLLIWCNKSNKHWSYPNIQYVSAPMSATCMPELEEVSIPASTASINSVTFNLTIQTIQQQMQMIQSMIEMMKRKNQKSKQRNPNLWKFYWNHKLCIHISPECRTLTDKNTTELHGRKQQKFDLKNRAGQKY